MLKRALREAWPPAVFLTILLGIWELRARAASTANPVLPAPSRILRAFSDSASVLPGHLRATLAATLLGVLIGVMAGVALAVVVSGWGFARRVLQPMLVATQTVPVQVLGPILVLWFGFGLQPKIVLVALVVFFPVAVSTAAGLQGVDPALAELVRSFGAGRMTLLRMVLGPAALPGLFAGLRISLTYAVAAAVIAEGIGARAGLGLYLSRSQRAFRYDQLWVGVLVVMALSIVLFCVVSLLGRLACPWQREVGRDHEK